MNTYQIIVTSILSLMAIGGLLAAIRGWVTRREALVWCLLCAAAIVATCRPQVTVSIAHALGIGRGADLVFYCAVVVMMIGFWMVYIRLRHLRRQITLLVRHLALAEARSADRRDEPGNRPSGSV